MSLPDRFIKATPLAFLLTIIVVCFLVLRSAHDFRSLAFHGIRSDGTFAVAAKEYDGWQDLQYDDDSWERARAPNYIGYEIPYFKKLGLMDIAYPIWKSDNAGTVFFRKTFSILKLPSVDIRLKIVVDDDYTVFLNGKRIFVNNDGAATYQGEEIDLRDELRAGRNVLAVQAENKALSGFLALQLPLGDAVFESARDYKNAARTIIYWLVFFLMTFGAGRTGKAIRRFMEENLPRLPLWICWPAWITWVQIFRLFPVYKPDPTAVFTPLHEVRLLYFIVSGLVLMALTVRSMMDTGIASVRNTVSIGPVFAISGKMTGIILIAVLLTGAFLRLYQYREIPPGIFQDDASFMKEGNLLLSSGEFRVWMEAMNGNATLMAYLNGLISRVFGQGLLSSHVAPTLLALLTIIAVFVLHRVQIEPAERLLCCFLLAVSHYHINYSRIPWDTISVPLFSILSIGFLNLGIIQQPQGIHFAVSGACLAAGLYGYAGFRAMPVIFFFILLSDRILLKSFFSGLRYLYFSLAFLAFISPLAIYVYSNPEQFLKRTGLVDIFSSLTRYYDPMPVIIQTCKTLLMFTMTGDAITCRHNTPSEPGMDVITGAFLMIGLAALLARRRTGSNDGFFGSGIKRWLPVWVLTGAVVSSTTFEAPHFSRSICLLVPCILIAGWGFYLIIRSFPGYSKVIVLLISVLLIGWLNYKVYFIKKLEHPNVYEDCGYLSLLFHDRLLQLQNTGKPFTVHTGPEMQYLSSEMLGWLHPEHYRQNETVLRNTNRLMQVLERNYPVHLFLHPKDIKSIDPEAVGQPEKTPYANPHKTVEFTEFIFTKPDISKPILRLKGHPVSYLKAGLMQSVYRGISGTGDPISEKASGIDSYVCDPSENSVLSEQISVVWEGYLSVEQPGIYGFRLVSDDGSFLHLDHQIVVDNGGEHGLETAEGYVELEAGLYPFRVLYYNVRWGGSFRISWMHESEEEWSSIPTKNLFH